MALRRKDALLLKDCATAELTRRADEVRQANFGKKVELCAIINIRNGNCRMDCKFCAQSMAVKDFSPPPYSLLDEDSLSALILEMAKKPYRHIGLVASGAYLANEELEKLLEIVKDLPPHITARLCFSLGRLNESNLRKIFSSGVVHYHHNLETSSRYYPQICSTQTWQARKETVLRALATGFEVCCGALFGMGETWEDRIDLALELAEMGIKNIPINFLHPQPGSALAARPPLTADEALRIVAIFRLILPDATLRICGGRPVALAERENEIFNAGANALMSGDYLTTKGKSLAHDLELLRGLGLELT